MAHQVESMFAAGTTPWHGLGTIVESEQTAKDALKLAGLDWRVGMEPVYAKGHFEDEADARAEGYQAVVRQSDRKVLGIVGNRYTPIQNVDAFEIFDSVVGEGSAVYHTAGSLDGGRRIWILAKLPGVIKVGKDVTEKYMLLANGHDGQNPALVLTTPVRIVCQNTINLAISQARDTISIRHTAAAGNRLAEAAKAMALVNGFYKKFEDTVHQLGATPFTDLQMKQVAIQLLPDGENGPSTQAINQRANLFSLFENGLGHEGIRGSAWAAVNAVAEFADHSRTVRGDDLETRRNNRLNSVWFGRAAQIKRQGFEIIQKMAA